MTEINICHCGAQSGYPHSPDCPYPLYRGSEAAVEAWQDARTAKREALGLNTLLPKHSVSQNPPMTREQFEALVDRVGADRVQIYWPMGGNPIVQDFSDPETFADPIEPATVQAMVAAGVIRQSPRSSSVITRYLHHLVFEDDRLVSK